MIIPIRDIPTEGHNFEWTEGDIKVTGFIYPIKNGFDINGEITAKVPMDCSFCANTIKIPVKEKFHEMVMLEGKIAKQLQETTDTAADLEIHYVQGHEINLKPIIDEVIGVNMPIQPKCVQKGAPAGFPECVADWDYQKYFEDTKEMPVKNPFEVLKNLKKN